MKRDIIEYKSLLTANGKCYRLELLGINNMRLVQMERSCDVKFTVSHAVYVMRVVLFYC